jgi:phosphoglycolate phosphatase
MKPALFFDLDGTLTDSGPGIMNCAQLALDHFAIPVENREILRAFVGPPLRVTFASFGIPEEKLDEAIRVFRSRYQTVGKFENLPYPGIPELLAKLAGEGYPLYVATSKPEVTAIEIMEHFQLDRYFRAICGATMDSSREKKADVIAYLLDQVGSPDAILMVGDTNFDVLGAAAHQIPTIGVTWGYGDLTELKEAGPIALADNPEELYQRIHEFSR